MFGSTDHCPDETSLSGFTPDEASLIRILKILGTFFVKKKGSIKQLFASEHSKKTRLKYNYASAAAQPPDRK
jgi:hypothetical protein